MRMRLGNAAENMNILRHLALNLLKAESSFKGSLNLKRKKCALSPSYLLKVFPSLSDSPGTFFRSLYFCAGYDMIYKICYLEGYSDGRKETHSQRY